MLVLESIVSEAFREVPHVGQLEEEAPNEVDELVDVGLGQHRLLVGAQAHQAQELKGGLRENVLVGGFWIFE